MNSRNGYSLIELLVAVAIFAIGVVAVMGLFAAAGRSHRMAVNRTRMALLAQTVLDEIRMEAHEGNSVKEVSGAEHPLFPGLYYDITAWPLDPFQREYLVEMFIRWYKTGREPAARRGPGVSAAGVPYYTIVCVR